MKPVFVLDIGTSKITCVVAELKPDGRMEVVGLSSQPSSGLKLMEKAAAAGIIEAIMEVASMYVADAYMHDNRKAREWYKRGAELGSEDARKAMEQMDAAAGGNPLAP